MDKFALSEVPEVQQLDVLILSGKKVYPLVLDDVKVQTTEKRRYLIYFLGYIGTKDAVTVLESIASEESEAAEFRTDALRALEMIDPSMSKSLAREIVNTGSKTNEFAARFLKGKYPTVKKRNFWDAFLGRGDG
jgi:HEAT repeat protein